jgi:predicted ATP-dependent serine protease
LPGRRRYGSSFGLALAMSLLASYLRRPMPSRCLFLGEVGLGRDIRPIEPRLVNDLIADLATAPEMVGSWRIFCHPKTVNDLTVGGIDSSTGSIKIVPCQQLETALYNAWPELR